MSNTAGAWILYRLTHSAVTLGFQGLCFSLPIAVLPLLTGILADRFSRLVLIKATLAVEAAQAFALAAVTAAGDLRPWMLYLAAAADACRLAVNIPAQSALVPDVVPKDMLPSALALSSSMWSSSARQARRLPGPCLPSQAPAWYSPSTAAARWSPWAHSPRWDPSPSQLLAWKPTQAAGWRDHFICAATRRSYGSRASCWWP